MTATIYNRVTRLIRDLVFRRFLGPIAKGIFGFYITLLFVHLPALCYCALTLGKANETREKQKRLRARRVDESDPSSPYRALEVLDKLRDQPEEAVRTLADIPDLCLKRFADKETMGIREITKVEDEKQPNGKVFKKVSLIVHSVRIFASE